LITWRSSHQITWLIYSLTLTNTGRPLGDPVLICKPTPYQSFNAKSVSYSAGSEYYYAITYMAYATSNLEIFVAIFYINGTSVVDQLRVNTFYN